MYVVETREFCLSFRLADENRKEENNAAVVIQSWFRGCKVRAYIRYHVYSQCAHKLFVKQK